MKYEFELSRSGPVKHVLGLKRISSSTGVVLILELCLVSSFFSFHFFFILCTESDYERQKRLVWPTIEMHASLMMGISFDQDEKKTRNDG